MKNQELVNKTILCLIKNIPQNQTKTKIRLKHSITVCVIFKQMATINGSLKERL